MAERNDNQLIELQKSQRFDSFDESLRNLSSSTVRINPPPLLYTNESQNSTEASSPPAVTSNSE